jgi:hypothetical protein
MIGPTTITRLIQITGRTDLVQAVSEMDMIAQVKVGYSQPATLSKQINEKSRSPQQKASIPASKQSNSNANSLPPDVVIPQVAPKGRAGSLTALVPPQRRDHDSAQPNHNIGREKPQVAAPLHNLQKLPQRIENETVVRVLLTALRSLSQPPPAGSTANSSPTPSTIAAPTAPAPNATALAQTFAQPQSTFIDPRTGQVQGLDMLAQQGQSTQTQTNPNAIITQAAQTVQSTLVPSSPAIAAASTSSIAQDMSWLVAVNAALIPGWPNISGQLQSVAAQNATVRDALAKVAVQLRNHSPQQRALILAQLGLPARALELIDRLAKRLANAAEDALEPDVIAGFLIALLTTLGQISDGLRAAYEALNTTKDD